MADAEAEQDAVERSGFGVLDLEEKVVGGLFADAFEGEEVFLLQGVDVGEGVDEGLSGGGLGFELLALRGIPGLRGETWGARFARVAWSGRVGAGGDGMLGEGVAEELGDESLAEAFDVHHRAGGEVAQLLFEAGGTASVDAPEIDLALFADQLGLAAGAGGGEDRSPA